MFCCFFQRWVHFAGEPRKLAIVQGIRSRCTRAVCALGLLAYT